MDQPEFASNLDQMKDLFKAFEEKNRLISLLDKCLMNLWCMSLLAPKHLLRIFVECSFVTHTYSYATTARLVSLGRWPETHGLPTDHGHCRPHSQYCQQNPDTAIRPPPVCLSMACFLDRQWWEIYVQVPESLSEAASDYLHGLGSTAVVFHEQAMLTPAAYRSASRRVA